MSRKVMILAGEASGDAHAAEFVWALRQAEPTIEISGMGGAAMRGAGVEVFFDSSSIAVVGLIEVLRHWGEIKRAMTLVKARLDATHPDLLILVDYPEFNLKMARHARELGIRVLFYISPQVWAWRPKRIHKIGRLIDHMAVIFRFEQEYYQRAGIPVSFVGHPLVDRVPDNLDPVPLRQSLGMAADTPVVGLFPGSRQSEVSRLLPILLDSARVLASHNPAVRFLLPVAPSLDVDNIRARCADSGLGIIISDQDIYQTITCCDAIATCSGTVTLEIALLGKPMCIVYRMSGMSYRIMSRLITIPHIGLANIVAGKAVVRELLQDQASAVNIAAEIERLIGDVDYRRRVIEGLSSVRNNLGEGNGAGNMARLVLEQLDLASK